MNFHEVPSDPLGNVFQRRTLKYSSFNRALRLERHFLARNSSRLRAPWQFRPAASRENRIVVYFPRALTILEFSDVIRCQRWDRRTFDEYVRSFNLWILQVFPIALASILESRRGSSNIAAWRWNRQVNSLVVEFYKHFQWYLQVCLNRTDEVVSSVWRVFQEMKTELPSRHWIEIDSSISQVGLRISFPFFFDWTKFPFIQIGIFILK